MRSCKSPALLPASRGCDHRALALSASGTSAKFSSSILNVEQTLFEKPYVACFELVGSANQLHAPLGWAFPTLGRFEDLTDAPADVSFDFDTLRKHCLRSQHRGGIVTRELRIQ